MDQMFTHRLKHALYCCDCACCDETINLDYIADTYCNVGTYSDRFYYLSRLNEFHEGISREIMNKKIEVLTSSYMELFDPDLPFIDHNVHICRFFFESATRIGKFRDTLLRYCEDLTRTQDVVNHLYDILPRCMLKDKISRLAVREVNDGFGAWKEPATYHESKQNVHLVDLHTKDGKPLRDRSSEFDKYVSKLPDDIKRMPAIKDIRINNSSISLRSLLVHVIAIISRHDAKMELYQRLREELIEMNGFCATGMKMRIINVLSGYSDEIQLKLAYEREMKATLFARFKARLDELPEDTKNTYYLGMIDECKSSEYIETRAKITSDLYKEILDEYKSIPEFAMSTFDSAFKKACAEL